MRDWSYGINSHPDWRRGHIDLIEQPWWLSLVERAASYLSPRWLDAIKLPTWLYVVDDGVRYSWREWLWSLHHVAFVYLTTPLLQWVWHHPRRKEKYIDLGYDRVRAEFYEDNRDFFDTEADRG